MCSIKTKKQALYPLVSIVIPAWNEIKTLPKTLDSLEQIRYPGKYEIIIVAGGPDGTYEYAKERSKDMDIECKVLTQTPRGRSAAYKKGVRSSKGEVVVLLDADTLVEKDWLMKLVEKLSDEYSAVFGNYLPLKDTWVTKYFRYGLLEQESTGVAPEGLCGGGSIAIKRSAIKRRLEELFDEDVYVGGDRYLERRLKEEGGKFGFAKDAKVYTPVASSLSEFVTMEVRWEKGLYDFMKSSSEIHILFRSLLASLTITFSTILTIMFPILIISWGYLVLTPPLLFLYYLFKVAKKLFLVYRYTGNINYLTYFPCYLFLETVKHSVRSVIFIMKSFGFGKTPRYFRGPR